MGEVALDARQGVSLEKRLRSCIALSTRTGTFPCSEACFDPMPGWRVMKSAIVGRSSGIRLMAVFTVLAWASIASGTARAGCSHSVRLGSPASRIGMGLALLDDAGTSSDTIARSSPRPERPVPCTGARCSRQPTPASTAPLLDLQRTGNWAILSASTQVAIAERDSSPHDDRILLPMADGTSIYHPPRRSSALLDL